MLFANENVFIPISAMLTIFLALVTFMYIAAVFEKDAETDKLQKRIEELEQERSRIKNLLKD